MKGALTEEALARLTPGDYRFCPDAECGIVYFGADAAPFRTEDVRVGVWQKEPFGDRRICYCFGESEASIRDEIARQGRSAAAERIRTHIAAGRCACDIRNPRGACCLGDVLAAVTRVEAAIANNTLARVDAPAPALGENPRIRQAFGSPGQPRRADDRVD